jgi:hypothetical protein
MGWLLLSCGVVLIAVGIERSYGAARRAVSPLVHAGEPTRARLEAQRPFPFRPRVRTFVARATLSVAWLAIALYGLFLASTAQVSLA